MIESKVVCKRSGCEQSFTPTAAVKGARRQFCSDSCRTSKYQPKQIRPLGPCQKCGAEMVGRHASRKYCEPCRQPSKPDGSLSRCTSCSRPFSLDRRARTRCDFCQQKKQRWILKNCIWCGDLFGSTRTDITNCSLLCRSAILSTGRFIRSIHRLETKACLYCKRDFATSMSTKKHCSKSCTLKDRPWKPEGMKAKGARSGYAKARREAQRTGDRDLTTYSIWKAEGGHCRLCGKATIDPTTPRKLKPVKRDAWASLDHIKPISAGGTHTWANAQLLCYPCNSGKVHTDRDRWGGAVKILESVRGTVPSDEFVNLLYGVEPA